MKRNLMLIIVCVFSNSVLCQYYVTGSDPGSMEWEQIKTPHFRLIYPTTFKQQAIHTANSLEYFQRKAGNTLDSHVKMTPVIIHDRTTIPSSETPYAPFRMEFFTAPPQDTYAQDWMDQLIIHEYRHANQYAALNQGFTKVLSYLLGEQGTFAMVGLFLPLWFMEGDATVAETAFCQSGRGRVPSFEMRFRAQLLDKGIYSYEKAFNKSYKDMTPGPYEVGYQIVGLAREHYGADIWSEVIKETGSKVYNLVPFSHSLKEQIGLNKYDLYKSITSEIHKIWSESDASNIISEPENISDTNKSSYTCYNIPVIFRDSLIIASRSSMDDLTKVVLIDRNKNETTLFRAGVKFAPESFSVSDSILYWSEMINDPRWTLRDYRVIKTYNFNTGKESQLTHRTRYFSPAISENGKFIATVEVTNYNKYYLMILNSKDGSIVKRIGTPDNLLFFHPRWSDDGRNIVTVVFGDEGNSIAIVNPESGDLKLLLPFTNLELKRPSFFGKYVIYSASYSKIENFYAIDTTSSGIFQITSARFGATDASVYSKNPHLIYSDYTADGYDLKAVGLKPDTWKRISPPVQSAFQLAEKLTLQENFIFNHDSVPLIQYPVKSYHKGLNLFNFHSWVPVGDWRIFQHYPE